MPLESNAMQPAGASPVYVVTNVTMRLNVVFVGQILYNAFIVLWSESHKYALPSLLQLMSAKALP